MFRKRFFPIIWNLCLILITYQICRVIYYAVNYNYFSHLTLTELLTIVKGGLRFDLSTICYTNALYILLALLPLHGNMKSYNSTLKYLFLIINGISIVISLADSVMYPYVTHRFTASSFTEYSNTNLLPIIEQEALKYWYLIICAIIILILLNKYYRKIHFSIVPYYQSIGILLLSSLFVFIGMRGTFHLSAHPLALRHAKDYVQKTADINLVLNTPYSILRTADKTPFKIPHYYTDAKETANIYTPIHLPSGEKKDSCNVVILILEGFAAEFSGYLNQNKGYMPFVDSLMQQGLTYTDSYANGRSSIDAQVSILSGIPKFIESFTNSHAAMNTVSSIGGELRKIGYHTSYFHGADNGSLGIDGYVKHSGIEHYYGRNEYNNDQDYDGVWGIWDEEFLQYAAETMTNFKQPFFSTVFTVTSHGPYQLPVKYKNHFPEGTLPIHKCIGYTDYAVRRFFKTASQKEWFKHTLFIITGDHTTISDQKKYQTENGYFRVPIIFYHPSDTTFKGRNNGTAQHIDIMPTVLDYIGTQSPYISFGCNLLKTPEEHTFAVDYNNGHYLYMQQEFLLIFNGLESLALYNSKNDPMLTQNLITSLPQIKTNMERKLKAIIQDYMTRMVTNKLTLP